MLKGRAERTQRNYFRGQGNTRGSTEIFSLKWLKWREIKLKNVPDGCHRKFSKGGGKNKKKGKGREKKACKKVLCEKKAEHLVFKKDSLVAGKDEREGGLKNDTSSRMLSTELKRLC